MGKSKTLWTGFWGFLEIVQEQTREVDRGQQNQQKNKRSNQKAAKRVGLDGKDLLSKDEHDMNYYEKIFKSYILGVIQRLYF